MFQIYGYWFWTVVIVLAGGVLLLTARRVHIPYYQGARAEKS